MQHAKFKTYYCLNSKHLYIISINVNTHSVFRFDWAEVGLNVSLKSINSVKCNAFTEDRVSIGAADEVVLMSNGINSVNKQVVYITPPVVFYNGKGNAIFWSDITSECVCSGHCDVGLCYSARTLENSKQCSCRCCWVDYLITEIDIPWNLILEVQWLSIASRTVSPITACTGLGEANLICSGHAFKILD